MTAMQQNNHLKKIYFRSSHRGCKETDLILGRYAEEKLARLDEEAIAIFEAFLSEDDADIWDWITGKTQTSKPAYEELIRELRERAAL